MRDYCTLYEFVHNKSTYEEVDKFVQENQFIVERGYMTYTKSELNKMTFQDWSLTEKGSKIFVNEKIKKAKKILKKEILSKHL